MFNRTARIFITADSKKLVHIKIQKKMKTIRLFLAIIITAGIYACGSNSDNESLSNPRQTNDVNARNPEVDHMHDSLNNNRNTATNTNSSSGNVNGGTNSNTGVAGDSVPHSQSVSKK
jgi:hypothetical protein